MFRFRRFTICDDRCAMKVGTDGVLLGAWSELPQTSYPHDTTPRIADIGCGSGLIALMLAQKYPEAQITGIEIDPQAAMQAIENVAASPFAKQIDIVTADFCTLSLLSTSKSVKYDGQKDIGSNYNLIVSNPPYFIETLHSPQHTRAQARHAAAGFSFSQLAEGADRMLCDGGSLQVILPKSAQKQFQTYCQHAGLCLARCCEVHTTARKPPKRILLDFRKTTQPVAVQSTTIVLDENGQRSKAYSQLCREFYL